MDSTLPPKDPNVTKFPDAQPPLVTVPPTTYDWRAVELDYRSGILPLPAISRKHGPSVDRIQKVALAKGWVRNYSATEGDLQAMVPRLPEIMQSVWSDDELIRAAAMTGAMVIAAHRKDIHKLAQIEQILFERLYRFLNGEEINEPFIGPRESPADLADKLSKIMVRRIELQRQAFGLDTFNPEGESKPKELTDEVKGLMDKINTLSSEKAASAKDPTKEGPAA